MAPLYDPATQKPEDATACIDQFEFPDIPCAYPVVWVQAREAAEICAAEGKRMCDANEWEDACQGQTEPPDYRFDLADGRGAGGRNTRNAPGSQSGGRGRQALELRPLLRAGDLRHRQFQIRRMQRRQLDTMRLQHVSRPATFPACHSPLEVYDLNGNAAEHMNLPLNPSQMSSRGSIDSAIRR